MKQKFLLFATMMAVIASCSDDNDVNVYQEPNHSVKTLTFDATLPSAGSTGSEAMSASASFTTNDFLRIAFYDSSDKQIGNKQILRPTTISNDGKSGTFSSSVAHPGGIRVPNNATTIYAYSDANSGQVTYGSEPSMNNLNNQNGTIESAKAHSVLIGTASMGNNGTFNMVYKTTILKMVLTLPEDAEPTTDNKTVITLNGKNLLNKVNIVKDQAGELSEYGKINTNPASVSDNVITTYMTVWPTNDTFADAQITVNINGTTYSADFKPATTVTAGGLYTVNSTLDYDVVDKTMWVDDDEYVITKVKGKITKAPDWATQGDGIITLKANTTGKPRNGLIILDNGSKYDVTQIGVNDFRGSWTLYAKKFDGNNHAGGSANAGKTNVTIGQPLKKETLPDNNGKEITNNIGVKGLLYNTIMNGTVIIDYEERTVQVGMFFDSREAQSTGENNPAYAVYLPEGAGSNNWGNYTFSPLDFSPTNYDWLWLTVSEDFQEMKYVFFNAGQMFGKYCCCGISIAAATSTDRSTINGGSSYDVIYQANYNGDNNSGLYFKRN